MKIKTTFLPLVLLLMTVCFSRSAYPAGQSKVSAGARMHNAHEGFGDLPFDDGDVSYGLAYEWHDQTAYWQVALYYAPDVNGDVGEEDEEDRPLGESVITPAVNLIMKDNIWRGGVGVLRSLVETEEDEEWTDIYWQFVFGLQFPAFGLPMDIQAFYIFEDWSALDEFDLEDVDFGLWMSFNF